ncbi:hypothetical protein [uncultured Roseibium sp.]|uniref:hypothetical protein n=1 Tax=uncultured Roseibium sp. TaxID=1936171 RepID=UPI00321731A6
MINPADLLPRHLHDQQEPPAACRGVSIDPASDVYPLTSIARVVSSRISGYKSLQIGKMRKYIKQQQRRELLRSRVHFVPPERVDENTAAGVLPFAEVS